LENLEAGVDINSALETNKCSTSRGRWKRSSPIVNWKMSYLPDISRLKHLAFLLMDASSRKNPSK
jgi:hypothetical protein